MDVAAARDALGLGPRPTWTEVRAAYRARIQTAHPDRAGGDTQRAAALNTAYATLVRAKRTGDLHEAPPPAEPDVWEPPPEVLDGDTIRLSMPPDEAFMRLLDAAHRIGDVTYVDRSCAIFETLVAIEGEGVCSLVVTLQGRANGTEAFCTLEAIEHVGSPPVRHVTEALVAAL
ncbi:MAG: J domain-containing protein [Acidimicrobiales bacterium]